MTAGDDIYNPLDKRHLADSIARAFFTRPLHPLPPKEAFQGAGIYAIYYRGDFKLYNQIADSCRRFMATSQGSSALQEFQPIPVYIGKSDAPGSRKGVAVKGTPEESDSEINEGSDDIKEAEQFLTTKPQHRKLFARLAKHAKSIRSAGNLSIDDFYCRYMLVDEIWVPLGEARLLELYRPLWNTLIEGFGSNPEGGGRKDTARPVWDILHPGRKEGLEIRVDRALESSIVRALRGALSQKALKAAIDEHRAARIAFNKALKSKKSESTT